MPGTTMDALAGSSALMLALLAISASPAPAAEVLPEGFPTLRGPLAFFNAQVYAHPEGSAAKLEWLSNFDLLVTNGQGLADEATRRRLQRRGCKLFLYAWTNGFYELRVGAEHQEGPWRTELSEHHRDWLLSPGTLPSHMGPPAFYFDLANEEMVTYRCEQLADHRAATGYDGIFFDYAAEWGLPDEVTAVWDDRHPDTPYAAALARFFRRLREVDPGVIIFTNQAYTSDHPLPAEVDHDMTESLATSHAWGPELETDGDTLTATFFRSWPGEFGIEGVQADIERKLTRAPPRRNFVTLDYMRPWHRRNTQGELVGEPDLEAVYYSYCASALWGRPSFCSGWFANWDYDGPLYFADLGKPLGEAPEVLDGMVVREFRRGLVALLTQPERATVTVELERPERDSLYDLFAGRWRPVTDGKVTLRLRPSRCGLSGEIRPAARVYLKADRP